MEKVRCNGNFMVGVSGRKKFCDCEERGILAGVNCKVHCVFGDCNRGFCASVSFFYFSIVEAVVDLRGARRRPALVNVWEGLTVFWKSKLE